MLKNFLNELLTRNQTALADRGMTVLEYLASTELKQRAFTCQGK